MRKISLFVGITSVIFLAGCNQTIKAVPATPVPTMPIEASTAPITAKIVPQDITINNFQFTPVNREIAVGESVQWINNDNAPHDIVANDGSFQSPILAKGENFVFIFTQTGTYTYYCSIHPSMKGTITIQ